MRSFVAPGLQELYLGMGGVQLWEAGRQAAAFLNDLARIEDLRLEKLKLYYSTFLNSVKLSVAIANLISANKDTITALELPEPDFSISFLPNYSLQNLNALAIQVTPVEGKDPIQTLVEGCPRVEHLRLGYRHRGGSLPDFSCVRKVLAWSLLSFELRAKFDLSEENRGEMAKAWPELKKLKFNWKRRVPYTLLPLSHLADIVAAFPELEDLEASFYYKVNDDRPLTNQLAPAHARPSRLRKLWLGMSPLPESQTHRECIAQFLALALPPGLRIESQCHPAQPGNNFGPEWDALIRRIEEFHGGVRIRDGSIPEDSDGVWF
ncbi:hypothetical protein FRC01_006965 [Tulasnella sp. 417]|nr:hypothetical protein FRC01_006965 [Tulasnella sp. 417]